MTTHCENKSKLSKEKFHNVTYFSRMLKIFFCIMKNILCPNIVFFFLLVKSPVDMLKWNFFIVDTYHATNNNYEIQSESWQLCCHVVENDTDVASKDGSSFYV